jgi:hypothetical protein
MKTISSLGSTFFSFIGGAIVASGTTVLVSIFLGSKLPAFWWVMFASGFAFIASSVFILRLSVQLSNLESSLASVPVSLSFQDRERVIERITLAMRRSALRAVICATALAVVGIGLLPARIILIRS